MSADAFFEALLFTAPCALLFAARYAALRARMSAGARGAYLKRSAVFVCGSVAVCALLAAYRGRLPFPAMWQIAAAATVFFAALGLAHKGSAPMPPRRDLPAGDKEIHHV